PITAEFSLLAEKIDCRIPCATTKQVETDNTHAAIIETPRVSSLHIIGGVLASRASHPPTTPTAKNGAGYSNVRISSTFIRLTELALHTPPKTTNAKKIKVVKASA
ncbi:MAG: hypothetical protein QXP20_03335, partial [Candidatus Bathyarchaeia archaeon]